MRLQGLWRRNHHSVRPHEVLPDALLWAPEAVRRNHRRHGTEAGSGAHFLHFLFASGWSRSARMFAVAAHPLVRLQLMSSN